MLLHLGTMAESPSNDDGSSDFELVKYEPESPKSVDNEVTIAQLPPLQLTSPPAPFTPSNHLSGKRKRLKPLKLKLPSPNAEKKRSPSKPKALHDPVQNSPTMIRAREIQSSLGTDYPTFVKFMLRSHVTTCFWMGLPVPFCRSYLPKHDILMMIEDENKRRYNLKYIAYKTGLSAGWRKYSLVHKLVEGDALIFQLVEPCKFKVYIVRSNDSKQVDGVLDLSNHNQHAKPMSSVKPDFSFEKVKTFKDFHIMVKNRCIDSELSDEIRMDYYKLCIAKKDLLHDNLPEGLYYKLVAGMIGETLNIANAIKNCKITTTKEEFETWDSSLKSFELIGMKVGFLRERIRSLTTLRFENEDAKIYVEAKEARKENAYRIKILKGKLLELKESNEKIDEVLSSLSEKAERYEVEFQEKVNAPW